MRSGTLRSRLIFPTTDRDYSNDLTGHLNDYLRSRGVCCKLCMKTWRFDFDYNPIHDQIGRARAGGQSSPPLSLLPPDSVGRYTNLGWGGCRWRSWSIKYRHKLVPESRSLRNLFPDIGSICTNTQLNYTMSTPTVYCRLDDWTAWERTSHRPMPAQSANRLSY